MYKYSIARIIGNDLPPRHAAGQHLNNLSFILENEFNFIDCIKVWIVNRIIDTHVESQIIEKLEYYKQHYYVIPFTLEGYDFYWDVEKKINFIIQINKARNFAIDKCKELSSYCALLDGSHFFNQEGWQELIESASSNIVTAVDTFRLKEKNQEIHNFKVDRYKKDEPVIFFDTNSSIQFNEDIPYGKRDKVELLQRLGSLDPKGYCLRLHDGTYLGFIRWMRERDRNLALANLINLVEKA